MPRRWWGFPTTIMRQISSAAEERNLWQPHTSFCSYNSKQTLLLELLLSPPPPKSGNYSEEKISGIYQNICTSCSVSHHFRNTLILLYLRRSKRLTLTYKTCCVKVLLKDFRYFAIHNKIIPTWFSISVLKCLDPGEKENMYRLVFCPLMDS